jgi:glycosyltransferase involved in cell wall biosynthesis
MRRIAIIGRTLDQEDGLRVYCANLVQELLRLDPYSEYLLFLRTPEHAQLFERFPNLRAEVLSAPRKLLWDQVAVPRAARRHNAQLIFNPKFSVPFFTLRPSVFVLQSSDWFVNPKNYLWWDNLYIRIMLPLYCAKAAHLLAISRTTAEDCIKHIGIKADKVTVSYAAASPHFHTRAEPAELARFKARYGLPERFIFTAARAYHTGHGRLPAYPGGNNERLLQGFRQYRASGGTLPMVVAGYRIEEYLRARGLGDDDLRDVHFTGFIPHEAIQLAYQAAEFFVLATLHESFGFPLVEALASGCPALVPSTGACPEIAGDAALLADPRDSAALARAMLDLESSPELRRRLRQAGLERVARFTWENVARRTLAVFDEVLSRGHTQQESRPAPGAAGSPVEPAGLNARRRR